MSNAPLWKLLEEQSPTQEPSNASLQPCEPVPSSADQAHEASSTDLPPSKRPKRIVTLQEHPLKQPIRLQCVPGSQTWVEMVQMAFQDVRKLRGAQVAPLRLHTLFSGTGSPVIGLKARLSHPPIH